MNAVVVGVVNCRIVGAIIPIHKAAYAAAEVATRSTPAHANVVVMVVVNQTSQTAAVEADGAALAVSPAVDVPSLQVAHGNVAVVRDGSSASGLAVVKTIAGTSAVGTTAQATTHGSNGGGVTVSLAVSFPRAIAHVSGANWRGI